MGTIPGTASCPQARPGPKPTGDQRRGPGGIIGIRQQSHRWPHEADDDKGHAFGHAFGPRFWQRLRGVVATLWLRLLGVFGSAVGTPCGVFATLMAASLRRWCGAFATPLLRFRCIFGASVAAPLLRRCGVFAAASLRFWCAVDALLVRFLLRRWYASIIEVLASFGTPLTRRGRHRQASHLGQGSPPEWGSAPGLPLHRADEDLNFIHGSTKFRTRQEANTPSGRKIGISGDTGVTG